MKNHCFNLHSLGLIFVLAWLLPYGVGASGPGDEHWDNQFGPVGASDPLYSITTAGGKVYVGGLLTAAGNAKTGYISGYDGTNWFALNNGLQGGVNVTFAQVLAADGSNVYAGGWFTNADDSGAKYLARWDGANWSPMGGNPANNPNSIVYALKMVGTNLYAGGAFTTNGGVKVNGIAQWNGSGWSDLGGGVSSASQSAVEAIEGDGTNVYVGGSFTQAGGVNATNVAWWNGTSWAALGTGFSGQIFALAKVGAYLYAGGSFTNGSLMNLARWDGSTWSTVGPAGANRSVSGLATDGTNLFVGGTFTSIGGISASRVAKWDGSGWSTFGTGIEGFGVGSSFGAFQMAVDTSGRVYVAGNFNQAGRVGASHVAGWDGTNWFALGSAASRGMTHFLGDVQSLCVSGTNFVAGGIFTEAGSQIVNGIAQWMGTNWSALGGAVPGVNPGAGAPQVKSLTQYAGTLYAGGSFTNIGGFAATNVAQWDGNTWSQMGSGLNGIVYALIVHKGVLFAGGAFTANGAGGSLHGIAQWSGSDWADVPIIDVWRVNNIVNALASDGNNLYVGGNFYLGWGFDPTYPTTGADVYNLGYWDGSFWWPVGSSQASNTVSALIITNGILYAGGSFTGVGGVKANRVAQWNSSSWSALGTGLNAGLTSGGVAAMGVIGNSLYVTGSFTNAGGTTVQGIAKWDGTTWHALGTGLYNSVSASSGLGHALITSGNDLYVGGLFTSAGDKPSMFIGHWNDQSDYYPAPHLQLTRAASMATNLFRFRVAGTSGESYIIQASTNFSAWMPVLTNSATLYDYTATNVSANPRQFYRAVFGP